MFSTTVEIMSLVPVGLRPSVHAAAKASPALPVSITALYDKIGRTEPGLVRGLVQGSARRLGPVEAKRRFTVADQVHATEGVECRKDAAVIDEIPMAYKDIDAVMAAQADLVEVVHTLRQVVCVKG